ncbi:conserved exported hypothetical protein [Candidatus Terasakiella magnetica]|uniref:DUF1007 family protein n=1 Tax=Candidatus Terasakiella magnetica TaxID=1867952 RepID=A0A1C3RFC0_9PROT|nr:DUF1007 family protein [Candidatus Terasakiella magnetica]SCA55980.1 conserved exported hypothetical protein [Candidatus Terasakiella magnetica]
MKFILTSLLFCTLFLSNVQKLHAHPHTWIDLETALIFDPDGKVSGLWVGWLFDDFYSAFTLEEMTPDAKGNYDQKALNDLAQQNLKNLSEYSYFTFINVDGKKAASQPVTDYKTHVEKNRLWMEFTVTLAQPIDPKTHKIDYAVYDPTYYVEILHAAEGDPIQLIGEKSMGCGYAMKKPEPPKELSLMAADMDKDETAGDGIGVYFSETVELSCP